MALKLCIFSLTTLLVSSQQEIDSSIPDICYAPALSGPCKGYFPQFYYNPLSGACDCFVFGGCGGNDNKFDTLDECTGNCSSGPQQSLSLNCFEIFTGSTDDPFGFGPTESPVVSPPPGTGVTLPSIDDESPNIVIRFGNDKVRPEATSDASPDDAGNSSTPATPLYPALPPTYVHAHPPYGLHRHLAYPYALPTFHSNFIYASPRSPYIVPYWLPYHQPTFRAYNVQTQSL
ncbi:unnamed protein product, partial [Meganyctiphanes norvegica]